MSNTALILFYTPDLRKEGQLLALCDQLGLKARRLSPADVNATIGSLAGLGDAAVGPGSGHAADPAQVKAPALYILPELMIFCGLSNEGLDHFLKQYREAGITPIPLKAVLTPYNIRWSLYELTGHLQEEHAMMTSRGRK